MPRSLQKSTLNWVHDNCPRAAVLGPENTLSLVQQVLTETAWFRVVVNTTGSIAGFLFGLWLANHWSISESSRPLYIGTILLGAVTAGLLATTIGQAYLHRKLEAAFEKA